jgi:hypothetical protein
LKKCILGGAHDPLLRYGLNLLTASFDYAVALQEALRWKPFVLVQQIDESLPLVAGHVAH